METRFPFLKNIRKAFFLENMKTLLILELETSISQNIGNFFEVNFFSELELKSVLGSSIYNYSYQQFIAHLFELIMLKVENKKWF